MPVFTRRAFTLIELLIVVAIIAILAAIAVPNFLEAQMRAKVSRVKNDLRTIATGLESYRVDYNKPPPTPFAAPNLVFRVMSNRLTTPVAYLSGSIDDPFIDSQLGDFFYFNTVGNLSRFRWDPAYPTDTESADPRGGGRYYYNSNNDPRRVSYSQAWQARVREVEGEWSVASYGPNRERDFINIGLPETVLEPYDPSNGTISGGDIIRTQKNPDSVMP
jgi:prepilin-type N-terminal cleavage/methylation domain-containing protein